MRNLKKFLLVFFVSCFLAKGLNADMPHYLDFKYILNNSVAGKKVQDSLKKRLNDGIKSLNSKITLL